MQKGDTLWGISGKFLKQPWRWPEIWRMNRDQIKNPHLIYPGDVIVLDKVNGAVAALARRERRRPAPEPAVAVDTRRQPRRRSDSEHPAGRPRAVPVAADRHRRRRAFPARPRSSPPATIASCVASGDYVYAVNVDEKSGTQWYIYRPGKVLHSFDSNETLGYEMRFLGTARVDRFGEVGTHGDHRRRARRFCSTICSFRRRAKSWSTMCRTPRTRSSTAASSRLEAIPPKPAAAIIVTLDRGTRDGLEVGHVLAIYHPTPVIADPRPYEGPDILARWLDQTRAIVPPTRYLNIPPERSGLLFVFRTFDKVSYALVLNAAEPVVIGDLVRKP